VTEIDFQTGQTAAVRLPEVSVILIAYQIQHHLHYLSCLCVQSRTPALIFEYVNNTDFKVCAMMIPHYCQHRIECTCMVYVLMCWLCVNLSSSLHASQFSG